MKPALIIRKDENVGRPILYVGGLREFRDREFDFWAVWANERRESRIRLRSLFLSGSTVEVHLLTFETFAEQRVARDEILRTHNAVLATEMESP
jgi:hypothetical protein